MGDITNPSGRYVFFNANQNIYMDLENGSTIDGTPAQVWNLEVPGYNERNQIWELTPLGDSNYTIKNMNGSLAILKDGTNRPGAYVEGWQDNPNLEGKIWRHEIHKQDYVTFHRFVNTVGGTALDSGGSNKNGSHITGYINDPTNQNQWWLLIPVGN